MNTTRAAHWILGLTIIGSASIALSADPKPQEPSTPPSNEEPASEEPAGLGDLDDLLGTGDKDKPKDETAAPAELPGEPAAHEGELERKLSAEEASEAFVQAIAQMSEAASRLEQGRDAGLVTQRLQEEIIRKLDVLIQNSQQQSSSSSSSSSSSQQNQQPSPQQQNQQQQNNQNQAENSTDQGERRDPPENMDPNLRQMFESASATWGALPERVRDMLMDGLESAFSANYKSMTEAYYRRLADEAEGP